MPLVPASQVSEFKFGTPKALREARGMEDNENRRGITLNVQTGPPESKEVIYIYNILDKAHVIDQAPLFKGFKIPACPPDVDFAVTTIARYTKEGYNKPGSMEVYYNLRDGREAANSLLNPDSHPGNPWDAQFRDIEVFGNHDMSGNNRNAFGCFWSLTHPSDPKLADEIKACRRRAETTLQKLVEQANTLNDEGNRKGIDGNMHFAMDYFHLEADWHKSHEHRIPCPNCGEPVRQGIAYHKNEFGDRCIIDRERYEASIEHAKPARTDAPTAAPRRSQRKAEPETA
jgi:hypothetical protein